MPTNEELQGAMERAIEARGVVRCYFPELDTWPSWADTPCCGIDGMEGRGATRSIRMNPPKRLAVSVPVGQTYRDLLENGWTADEGMPSMPRQLRMETLPGPKTAKALRKLSTPDPYHKDIQAAAVLLCSVDAGDLFYLGHYLSGSTF